MEAISETGLKDAGMKCVPHRSALMSMGTPNGGLVIQVAPSPEQISSELDPFCLHCFSFEEINKWKKRVLLS